MAFEVKYKKDLRWLHTERFPYLVVYVVNHRNVVILGVVSIHRNPKIWKGRT